MDISKEYILMSEKAVEIQKEHKKEMWVNKVINR